MTSSALVALVAVGLLLTAVWSLHLRDRDASIVDPIWGLAIWTVGVVYALDTGVPLIGARLMGLVLVTLWALRLGVHLHIRHGLVGEDRRYRAMREKRGDDWWWKSLYVVFLLQAVLAWIVALPMMAVLTGSASPGALTWAGLVVAAAGFVYESIADGQLAHYKHEQSSAAESSNSRDGGQSSGVMDSGLWRYSRHPNYFGEIMFWWGIGAAGATQGIYWAPIGSAAITFMLLKVSGVTMTESDIGDRKPSYKDYVRRTNAVLPGPPRD